MYQGGVAKPGTTNMWYRQGGVFKPIKQYVVAHTYDHRLTQSDPPDVRTDIVAIWDKNLPTIYPSGVTFTSLALSFGDPGYVRVTWDNTVAGEHADWTVGVDFYNSFERVESASWSPGQLRRINSTYAFADGEERYARIYYVSDGGAGSYYETAHLFA